MKKRLLSLLLVSVLSVTLITGASANSIQPHASDYLAKYTIAIGPGSNTGEVVLAYSVVGTGRSTTVGVKKVEVYRSNGSYVTTIVGTTANGFLRSSTTYHGGTYTYKGVSGTSYYMVVTVYASNSNGSDSRVITTNTAKAP